MSALGLINTQSAGEVQQEMAALERPMEANSQPLLDGLARVVIDAWHEARDYKNQYEPRFIEAQYANRGEYLPAKLAQIQETGASTEYARIIANKSRILEAWLKDIFLNQEQPPWSLQPSVEPELSQNVVDQVKAQLSEQIAMAVSMGQPVDPIAADQMVADHMAMMKSRLKVLANQKAERMATVIHDQLIEAQFRHALSDFINYLVIYPSAILKGPVFEMRPKLKWSPDDAGAYQPTLAETISMRFYAVNPYNLYPSPGAESPQEGYLIEVSTISYGDLYNLIGVAGYREDNIREVLSRAENGLRWLWQYPDNSSEKSSYKTRGHADSVSWIDILEYHGPVLGKSLLEWGEQVDDPQRHYACTVWLVDRWVIKAVVNDDPLGRRPYFKTSYQTVPGEFWGLSLYDVLKDVQGVSNAAVRSLVNNLSIASGPQAIINVDRLPANQDLTNLYPWKIWQVNDISTGNTSSKPVDFFQPNSNVAELLKVLEVFYGLADDFSLIPKYMTGNEKMSGPGRTASGLSMLLDAANKGLKAVVQGIDENVLTPLLQQLFDYNMLYNPDATIKGDLQVAANGVTALMQIETLRMRRNEFLQITANPIDSPIVGLPGRAEILRELAKGLGLDHNKVIPPDAQLMQKVQEYYATMQQAMGGGQPQADAKSAPQAATGGAEKLEDGAPTTDLASPIAQEAPSDQPVQ